jgi:CDP-diacylglycerol--serine O-phosphatidyltransferase
MATLLSFLLYPAHYSFTGSSAFNGWIIAMPMIFTALTTGHFMSQILAEQLRNNRKTAAPSTGGPLRSFINLHMDAGTLCWIYIFIGFGPVFVIFYALLLLANAATVLLSMRRKYVSLATPAE